MTGKALTKIQLLEELEELRKQHENLVIENFEQKIVEGILIESKGWLQRIIQQMPFPIEISASDGSTVLVNDAFLNMFNYENIDDVINRYNIYNDAVYAGIIDDIKAVYRGDKIFSAEITLFIKDKAANVTLEDGSSVLEVIMFPLVSLAGEVRRVVKIWKDITGQKKAEELSKKEQISLEEVVRKRTEGLIEANKTKDKFFSLISHDLRSPFNGMLGVTNILVDDFDSLEKEEIRPFVENLRSSTVKIYNLIENLLEWSNIMLDRVAFNPSEFDIYEEIIYASELIKPEAEKNKISIHNLIEENTIVYADRIMMQSVLSKLLLNSIRFNRKNGDVKISAKIEKTEIEISIIDNGMGIEKYNLENMFKIDVNTKTADLENEVGSGLSLIICKELIEKNSGKLRLESEAGKWTKVSFSLPLKNMMNN